MKKINLGKSVYNNLANCLCSSNRLDLISQNVHKRVHNLLRTDLIFYLDDSVESLILDITNELQNGVLKC